MSAIPLAKTGNAAMDQFASRLKAEVDPVLANVLVGGSFIKSVSLLTGNNVINHLLGRNQLGWILVDQSTGVTIYRSAPLNNKTLTLNSSGAVTISLWVF